MCPTGGWIRQCLHCKEVSVIRCCQFISGVDCDRNGDNESGGHIHNDGSDS